MYETKFKGFFFLALMSAFILFLCGPAYGQGKLIHQDNLIARAKEKGSVRVIVTFSVPGLGKRQRASRLLKVLPPGVKRSSSEVAGAKKADAALAEAIRSSALVVFAGLGLEKKMGHVFKTVPQAVIKASYDDLLSLVGSPQVMRVVEDKPIPVPVLTPVVDTGHGGWGSYGVNIINAPRAWAKGYDGEGCYVAVLDTGVRTSHEMFTGKNVVEACFSTTDQDFSLSLCPGGVAEAEGPGSAIPPDRFGHGTHVSGIAVGNQPDGDLKGVAPGADLIAIQIFSYIYDWEDVGSYFSDQIKGLEYVYGLRAAHSIAAVNMSLGDGKYDNYCDDDTRAPVIDNLRAAGIAVTVANGNEYYCEFLDAPACVSSAIAVGASDYNDRACLFNNWDPIMQDVFAPGRSIYSANAWGDKDYSERTGTSMAAPHVAGAWAIFRQSAPTATVSAIENAMKNGGVALNSGCDTEPASGPRLDVAATLNYFLTPVVTTQAVTGIGATTATGNGIITALGDPNPTQHGLCWNIHGAPTIADRKTEAGQATATGAFTSNMTGLSPGTTYHVRAYATNTAGTGYGNDVNFKTAYASTLYVSSDGYCGYKFPCFNSIQHAIYFAATGSAILIAGGIYDGPFVLNQAKLLTLQGGWNSSFSTQTGNTTLREAPKANLGSLIMQDLNIKQ